MDPHNPAVRVHTSLSPADLDRAVSDPSFIHNRSKKMLLVLLDHYYQRLSGTDVTVPQLKDGVDLFTRVAFPKAADPAGQGGSTPGFSVSIVLTPGVTPSAPVTAVIKQATDVEDVEVVGSENQESQIED